MPRTVQDAQLRSRSSRRGLKQKPQPYFAKLFKGLAVGYRKGAKGGTWIARRHEGGTKYSFRPLGVADDVADADGMRVLSFDHAQEAARSWFKQKASEDAGEVLAGAYTLSQAMDDYLSDRERVKRKPLARTRAIVRAHILPSLGNVDLSKLTHGKIKSWRDGLAEVPPRVRTRKGAEQSYRAVEASDPETMRRRQATANRILTVLKAALNYAHENRRVTSKAAWEVVKPFRQVDLPKVRFLTPREVTTLTNECESNFRILVQAALLTGCRYGELTAMRVDAFESDSETVFVEKSKGGKARHIVLNGEGVAFFSQLTKHRLPSETLFLRVNGKPWKTSEQKRPMDRACKAANIGCVNFHVLRHTYASQAVMNGVPIAVVADQLGHKDTRITERHYAHLCRSYKREIIRTNLPSFGFVDAPRDTEPLHVSTARVHRHHSRSLPVTSKSARRAV